MIILAPKYYFIGTIISFILFAENSFVLFPAITSLHRFPRVEIQIRLRQSANRTGINNARNEERTSSWKLPKVERGAIGRTCEQRRKKRARYYELE